MDVPLLEVRDLVVRLGGIRAVDVLSTSVAEGEVLGVMGPNGAGKTTLFNAIGGVVRPTAGQVIFEGRDISHLRPHARCALGICRTYQTVRPFL